MKIGQTGSEKTIPTPKTLDVEPFEIARTGRTASGKMTKDIIAIKKRFTLSYQGLGSASMKIFSDIYNAGQPVSLIYNDSEGEKTVSVYITSLPWKIPKQRPDLSQDVTITMEEV